MNADITPLLVRPRAQGGVRQAGGGVNLATPHPRYTTEKDSICSESGSRAETTSKYEQETVNRDIKGNNNRINSSQFNLQHGQSPTQFNSNTQPNGQQSSNQTSSNKKHSSSCAENIHDKKVRKQNTLNSCDQQVRDSKASMKQRPERVTQVTLGATVGEQQIEHDKEENNNLKNTEDKYENNNISIKENHEKNTENYKNNNINTENYRKNISNTEKYENNNIINTKECENNIINIENNENNNTKSHVSSTNQFIKPVVFNQRNKSDSTKENKPHIKISPQHPGLNTPITETAKSPEDTLLDTLIRRSSAQAPGYFGTRKETNGVARREVSNTATNLNKAAAQTNDCRVSTTHDILSPREEDISTTLRPSSGDVTEDTCSARTRGGEVVVLLLQPSVPQQAWQFLSAHLKVRRVAPLQRY